DDDAVVVPLHEVPIARILEEPGDAVHRPVERALLPAIAVRRPILHRGHPVGIGDELQSVGPLGAEAALVHGAVWIALDGDGAVGLGENEETAPNGAVRTHAVCHLRSAQTGVNARRSRTDRLLVTERACSIHVIWRHARECVVTPPWAWRRS